jgi:protein-S-isoprenylcysteine O-methyltransferase Ste14
MYCVVHSALAAAGWKQWLEQNVGAAYKYYRIGYSIFATLSLAALLWYHFTFPSGRALLVGSWPDYAGGFLTVTGSIIMTVCIRKYFFNLSGIDVFFKKKDSSGSKLEQEGLHRYTRHPLYLGTLMFGWGLFFIMPYLHNLIANVVITVYVLVAISWEEKKLVAEFGNAYTAYAEKVPRLIPYKLKIKK